MSGIYDNRDIQRWSANSRVAAHLGARSTRIAVLADRPSNVERGLSGIEQTFATVLVLIMLALTGVAWNFVPFLGAAMVVLGVYFVTRRLAAFSGAPTQLTSFFFRAASVIPAWAWLSALSVIGASALYRSVVIAWLPAWLRDTASAAAIVAAVLLLTVVPFLISRAIVRAYRKARADEAEADLALAHMLGGNPRLFLPDPQTGLPQASWNYAKDGSVVVHPHATFDPAGAGDRLAQTSLGTRFEIDRADWQSVVLLPISEATAARLEQRRASGGLVEGVSDLAGVSTTSAPVLDLDDDDPFGATPIADTPGDDSTPTSFGEEAWR